MSVALHFAVMLVLLLKHQLFGPPDTHVQVGDYTIDFDLFPVKSFDDFIATVK
jgi:hypothetical protein